MIFKNIFAEKNWQTLMFLTQCKVKLCNNMIMTLLFEEKRLFFAENCRKSQKIDALHQKSTTDWTITLIKKLPGLAVQRTWSQRFDFKIYS
jgi:hypothetical protein